MTRASSRDLTVHRAGSSGLFRPSSVEPTRCRVCLCRCRDVNPFPAAFYFRFSGVVRNIRKQNIDLIDLRFELKGHVTREEWAQLFAGQ